jgi:acyl carrier protein
VRSPKRAQKTEQLHVVLRRSGWGGEGASLLHLRAPNFELPREFAPTVVYPLAPDRYTDRPLVHATFDIENMDTLTGIRTILRDTLQLGDRAERLTAASPLLGGIPEFDSMAVVTLITMIEDRYGITVDDDELSADTFATVGSLAEFVARKTSA